MKIVNRSINKLGIMLSILSLMLGCTSDYEDINTNKNAVATVGKSELPYLFSKAQSQATLPFWFYQVGQNLFADQYAQYFACNATYFPSDRLVMRHDWVRWAFNPVYTSVVPQLQTLFASSDQNSTEYALASIWWVYTFHRVTDYWGPVPYFSAGVTGKSVPYDAQDKIYDDFFKRLSAALTILKAKAAETPFGKSDLLYSGDLNKWMKFANTLRLRLALRISKVDPARAKTEAEAAFTGGVFTTSPADDALMQRSTKGNDVNGLSIMSPWNEFRMSASMESVLKGYEDPRLGEYFLPAAKTGTYEGLRNGLTVAQLTDASAVNKAEALSHVGKRWSHAEIGGNGSHLSTPQIVMCTAEAYFLRAEGALNGWNMGGTAKELYEKGITASMNQWGIADAAAISAYVNSNKTPIPPNDFLSSPAMTSIPVLFHPSDVNIQREQIATQKWLALFPDGIEAWADFRRSRALKLYPVANSDNSDITNTNTQIVRRITFLPDEYNNNGEGVKAAIPLLGTGGDKVTTPLWWDKN